MKRHRATLVAVVIFCEKLDREVVVPIKETYFSASEGLCEVCGSHGEVTVDATCECGKSHVIVIKAW